MADENFTLATFYEQWQNYQRHIRDTVAPLTPEQLTLRASPDLRTAGEITAHIIGCRVGWFMHVLNEDGGPEVEAITHWDEPGATPRTSAELAEGLERTWQFMAECIARWTPEQMREEFEDDWGEQGIVHLSRAWIVWHVLEHDLHHGGELSLTLGMHGVPADFPG